ncbi:MAG TPA: EF-hand domain-containing protein [Pirellulales bacterium]|jgi:Ca2+-binding EF-hand superfamily protein|nr:EF-hand domain-containing protein [Pirellulales bacterium]
MPKARSSFATTLLLAASCATVNLLTAANAEEEARPDRTALFERLDANGDGQISEDEVADANRRLFGRLLRRADADADGKLSRQEFTSGMTDERPESPPQSPGPAAVPGPSSPPRPGGLLRVLDTNGDGKLSKEEIAAASESLRKLDRDNDGEVSQRELTAVLRPQPRQVPPPPGEKRPDDNQPPEATRLLERLRSMDADGDGKWKEGELPPFLRQQFAKIDANEDGFVEADELRRAFPSLRRPQQ